MNSSSPLLESRRLHGVQKPIIPIIASLIREYGPARGKELFLESPEYHEASAKWPEVARSLAEQFDDPRVEETVAKFVRIIRDKPCESLEQLRSIRVPTLVLANDLDPIHPLEFGPLLAKFIPGAQFRQITAKSISVETHERDVQEALEEFFQTHFS